MFKNVQNRNSTAPFAVVGTFEFWLCLVIRVISSSRELLRLFINSELIKWSGLCDVYETELRQGSAKYKATDVFNPNTEEGQKRWKDLRSRVVEHVSTRYFKMCVKT
jgi:predicted RNA-binding protein with PUA-like domain